MTRSLATTLLVPLIAGACELSEPTAAAPASRLAAASSGARTSAQVELVEFGPRPVRFPLSVACLGGTVTVNGNIWGWDRIVEQPDGSTHVTEKLDVSDVTVTLGTTVWTAGPNASEIFVRNVAADGSPRQFEHVGVVIFRAADGQPELQFVHQIHMVRLPNGEGQLNQQIVGIRCIGQAD
jgi:hypothetical protein